MPATDLPDADALLASLLSLMTQFSCLGCPEQALLIQRELKLIQSYPDQSVAPLLKGVARRLENEWQQLHFAIADDPAPVASAQRLALH